MERTEAIEWVKKHGVLPEPPAFEDRKCLHATVTPTKPCSCHLTIEQLGVAQGLGDYTLYVFGIPYTGRLKVPFYPGSGLASRSLALDPAESRARHHRRSAEVRAVDGAAKVAAKSEYDRAWRAAKSQGEEALAKFKAEWKSRKEVAA